MEPITLMGLIVVVYAGYVALGDLLREHSVKLPQGSEVVERIIGQRVRTGHLLKTPVKKMAGLNI